MQNAWYTQFQKHSFVLMQHRAFYVQTCVRFIVAGDKNGHKSAVVQHLIFLYSWQWHAAQQHTRNALLFPLHLWLGKRITMLRYTYITCLVDS